tara:strand:- start:276 stop:1040 length:765 start_codon:yes stop_codon:yes gene_type:complete
VQNAVLQLHRKRELKHQGKCSSGFLCQYLVVLFGLLCFPVSAHAEGPVRIASNIGFDANWLAHALPDQRKFVTRLRAQNRPVIFESLPYNRFQEILESGEIDCVMGSDQADFENSIATQSKIRFELRLFRREGVDLRSLPVVNVGILANLPRPHVPLSSEIHWHDLRSLDQAVELLVAGRLDAIVGDATNIRMYGRTEIVQADLPPVITANLSLICRDTEPLREFVGGFDSSMGVSSLRQSQPDESRYTVMNGW